jgi:hypothetical protein
MTDYRDLTNLEIPCEITLHSLCKHQNPVQPPLLRHTVAAAALEVAAPPPGPTIRSRRQDDDADQFAHHSGLASLAVLPLAHHLEPRGYRGHGPGVPNQLLVMPCIQAVRA